MVLVVGATGMVGSQICRRLAATGTPVRALVRSTSDPDKVAALRAAGIDTVMGDLRDAASLAEACRGVTSVVTTVSSMPFSYVPTVNDIDTTDREGAISLIDAARAAGVQHFVYTSFSNNLDRSCPLRDAKRTVERHLMDSGLAYTILRPSCFMEVWLSPAVGFDPANSRVTIYGTGDRPISYISIDDVVSFAITSLTEPAMRNRILELGGPRPVPQLEAARIFERAMGRTFDLTFVPASALESQADAATDGMQKSFATLMRSVADGDAIEMGRTAQLVAGPLTTIEEYAARTAPVHAPA